MNEWNNVKKLRLPGQWRASRAMNWREEEGERREKECQEPIWKIRRRERSKLGNLKGNSLAVRREQNRGPCDHEEERPLV